MAPNPMRVILGLPNNVAPTGYRRIHPLGGRGVWHIILGDKVNSATDKKATWPPEIGKNAQKLEPVLGFLEIGVLQSLQVGRYLGFGDDSIGVAVRVEIRAKVEQPGFTEVKDTCGMGCSAGPGDGNAPG